MKVYIGLALKVTSPFTYLGFPIGCCFDPRGLGIWLGITPAIISLATPAIFAAPFVNVRKQPEMFGIGLLGLVSLAITYGCYKLERYCWNKSAVINNNLKEEYDKALACETLLLGKFDMND